eukprot:GFYU01014093.1.p1 GENE.GFYU01014093.1~~GFYU01014093.1.p1  ORF type:complete len:651 (+),score=127.12 GFYU01014093.1:427-2379(+)
MGVVDSWSRHLRTLSFGVLCALYLTASRYFWTLDAILILALYLTAGSRNTSGYEAFFEDEFGRYSFASSLWDIVLCSFVRSALVGYVYRNRYGNSVFPPIYNAIITTMSVILVIIKAILFEYTDWVFPMAAVVMLVLSFVLSWWGTYLLRRVITRQKNKGVNQSMGVSAGAGMLGSPLLDSAPTVDKLHDHMSQFISIDGVTVHCKRTGDAPVAIVLIHGIGGSCFTWRHLIGPLSQVATVIAFDRPGWGLTSRPIPGDTKGEGVQGQGVHKGTRVEGYSAVPGKDTDVDKGKQAGTVVSDMPSVDKLEEHSNGGMDTGASPCHTPASTQGTFSTSTNNFSRDDIDADEDLELLHHSRSGPNSHHSTPARSTTGVSETPNTSATTGTSVTSPCTCPRQRHHARRQVRSGTCTRCGHEMISCGEGGDGGNDGGGGGVSGDGVEFNPYTDEYVTSLIPKLLDHFGVERAVLVAHSTGANIAMRASLEYPERTIGIVTLSPAMYSAGYSSVFTSMVHHSWGRRLVRQMLYSELGERLYKLGWHDRTLVTDNIMDQHRLPFQMGNWDVALKERAKVAETTPVDVIQMLRRVEVPVLVVSGVNDRIIPAKESQKVSEDLSQSEFVEIADCGHYVQEEKPEELLEQIYEFMFALPM